MRRCGASIAGVRHVATLPAAGMTACGVNPASATMAIGSIGVSMALLSERVELTLELTSLGRERSTWASWRRTRRRSAAGAR